jgi:hypothetical protein
MLYVMLRSPGGEGVSLRDFYCGLLASFLLPERHWTPGFLGLGVTRVRTHV